MEKPRRGAVTTFWEGFTTPWAGFRFMNRHSGLWRYAALPVLLNLLITGLVLLLLVAAGFWYADRLHSHFAGSWWLRALEVVVVLGLFAFVIGLALGVWLLLQSILCGYFYARLARQVELQLGLRPEEIREVSLGREIVDGVRDLLSLLVVNGGLLLLHLVPVVGSFAAVGGSLYFDCWILGLDYLEYPLALRGQKRDQMRQFARQHRAHTLGLGAAVLGMAFVPVLNAVFLTTAATGAVLLHRKLTE